MMENVLSAIAIAISVTSLGISLYMARLDESPYLCLKSIKFDRKNFKIIKYSEKLLPSVKAIINSTKKSLSMQKINGKEYLLVNLVEEQEYDLTNVVIVLSPMECSYVSRGGYINELILSKASMIFKNNPNTRIYPRLKKLNEKIIPLDNKEIVIRVAYACDKKKTPSIDYKGLKKEKEDFDYLMNIDKAKKYINFLTEEFIFFVQNYKGKRYKKKMILKMHHIKGLSFQWK